MKNKIEVWASRKSGYLHRASTCSGTNRKLLKKQLVSEQEILERGYSGICRCLWPTLQRLDETTWQERAREKKV